ncbi:NAD(P)-binding domain-containing protein [Candidatus Curtissbacteria bacterium]|nr:NAD(P)-binding domain-containing protein [Candidatus Curtissbacteria bacterium]
MQKDIETILKNILSQAKGRLTGFVIGNTSGIFERGRFYPTPIRETHALMYGGVIVRDVTTAIKIARQVDGRVDYVILDSEKKIEKIYYGKKDSGNIERHVRKEISKSKIVTYKGNDMTVEAIDFLLGQVIGDLGARTIAVIGLGNVGSKIALKLAERGAYVHAYRRDQHKLKKIVAGLNLIKSEHTISYVSSAKNIMEACAGASVVIAAADARGIIGIKHLKQLDENIEPVLIDVGKGCFTDKVMENEAYTVYRIDVSMVQKHAFTALLETKAHYSKSLGRRTIAKHNINLVSLGLLGKRGEIIVDDINKPSAIIGVANGNGSLVKRTEKYAKALQKLKTLYAIH